MHAGIAVLHVNRKDFNPSLLFLKSRGEQERFTSAIPRAEGEVSDTVKNRAVAIDLEWLDDVRMMADNNVRATINCKAGLCAVLGGRLAQIRHAPVKRGDDAIHPAL